MVFFWPLLLLSSLVFAHGAYTPTGYTTSTQGVCTAYASFSQSTGLCQPFLRCAAGVGNAYLACSNHGACSDYHGHRGEYCVCDPGWTGQYCDTPSTDTCDCGVSWDNTHALGYRSLALTRGGPVLDSDAQFFPSGSTANDPRSGSFQLPVGSLEQAQYLCYAFVGCDGVIVSAQTGGALLAGFVTLGGGGISLLGFPSTATLWMISRTTNYPCASASLDPAYYFAQYSTAIVSQCRRTLGQTSGSEFNIAPPDNGVDACVSDSLVTGLWTQLHWQHYGHTQRYSPNAGCSLQPTLYDPATGCSASRPGCVGWPHPLTDLPCSSQGYCEPVSTTVDTGLFQCQCMNWPGVVNPGISLAGTPEYSGRACQYNIGAGCLQPSSTVATLTSAYCSGHPDRCYASLVWDGISVFDVNNPSTVDYVPACHCPNDNTNALPVYGQWCEHDRCGNDAVRCNSLVDSGNQCVKTTAVDSNGVYLFTCQCGNNWYGPLCQYSASACLYNGVKCNGHGSCNAPNATTTPSCTCDPSSGYFGQWCQLQSCSSSVMVPNHGKCANNAIDHCYAVYSGTTCQIDVCAASNGTVALVQPGQTEPSQCVCPVGTNATFALNGDPSCWPVCPTYNGAVCGGVANVCAVGLINGVRTATCVCSSNYLPVQLASGATVCDLYCLNGEPDPTVSWDNRNPPACVCTGTGFTSTRCDLPVCQSPGQYNATSDSCICPQPLNPATDCASDNCNNTPRPAGFTKGVVINTTTNGVHGFACACDAPFGSIDPTQPYDCDANYCGVHGRANSAWTRTQPFVAMCTCTGKFKSVCPVFTDPHSCQFCATSTCLNGGVTSLDNTQLCLCTLPFVNGALGRCESNACNPSNTVDVNANGCVCSPAYSGVTCDDAVVVVTNSTTDDGGSSSSSSSGGWDSSSSNSSSGTGMDPAPLTGGASCAQALHWLVVVLVLVTLVAAV